ncbi:hypothetical protein [Prauserella cavernicola]|uniref:Uncharacterized protein n=1 Tax=Prauserella cavernicola TaxID=2800127 RepID=A0A934QUK5_9PSEU|nr:hypothetical protein [Prauserella cavernicola]MBK1788527.1 hypothetical protein [Prauserella cavernicola]
MSTSALERARDFLLLNARLLERRLAELWLGEPAPAAAHAVLAALAAYRNPDGGLGHALEPDARAPESQPLAVDFALRVVEQVLDSPAGDDPGVRAEITAFAASLVPYLESVAAPSGGLPIVLPSVARYPRARHWGDGVFPPGLNPTAGIVTCLRRAGVRADWLDAADVFCRERVDALTDLDGHAAHNALHYLGHAPDRPWALAHRDAIAARLGELPYFHLYPGEGYGLTYGLTPLDIAPLPQDPLRELIPAGAVAAHLAELAAGQQTDGGWALSWEPPGPAAELEWRGVVTLQAARVLAAN